MERNIPSIQGKDHQFKAKQYLHSLTWQERERERCAESYGKNMRLQGHSRMPEAPFAQSIGSVPIEKAILERLQKNLTYYAYER
ncbi:unnamed protein product [Urochloa humidicola]